MISAIHTEALHNRAKAARAEASEARMKFIQAAADYLVTSCPPTVAPELANYVKSIDGTLIALQQFPSAPIGVTNDFAGHTRSTVRDTHMKMILAVTSAGALTAAAQTLEYRATL